MPSILDAVLVIGRGGTDKGGGVKILVGAGEHIETGDTHK
jgi:hypothetical protein